MSSTEEIIETVERIAPVFGGINLEDIAAPACFEVEERLRESLDIPVFHDDQHGTAVVTLAALENALKIVDKRMADLSVVIAGAGAAGVAIAKILKNAGVQNIIGADRQGAIHNGRTDLNEAKRRLADETNPEQRTGTLAGDHARHRRLRRRERARDHHPGRRRVHGGRPDRVRHGQPRSRDPARGDPGPRRGHRHRAQRLPEPDQQRAGLPRASSGGRWTRRPRP